MHRIVPILAISLVGAGAAFAATPTDQASIEQQFDAAINPNDMRDWLKIMAAEPNNVGTDHDKQNAEWELAQFKEFGWDAHIETYKVLYPTPVAESITLLGKEPFAVPLTEPPIKGDSSATAKYAGLPAYLAYQGDGDVTAPLVYVNYGMQNDYLELQRLGISVAGKIAIVRYGHGWRGLKVKLAQEHGAVGCIIYSDPADDGYAVEAVYPTGPARPPAGIQRGSVIDMTLYGGDALTPGVGATADAKRLAVKDSPVILKIPALPISYSSAKVLLATMTGDVVPPSWRGSLPETYRVGPSSAKAHLKVKSDWSLKTIYDVIAMMKGSEFPDQWVMRGNHHDGWVFGGADPLSGQVALLDEAKAIGELAKSGWRPKRTIVYMSWDGEEPGLLGSTEWVEEHADELKQKGVLYINSDTNGRGFLEVGGNHDLEHFVTGIAAEVTDPETKVSVGERARAHLRVEALHPSGDPEMAAEMKEDAKIAADPSKDIPIYALGSGSDYSAFLEFLGLPALSIEYGGEGSNGGVYHSRYDTFEHYARFGDPGFVYDAVLAKTIGRAVLRAADSELPLQRAGDFARTVDGYLKEIEKTAKDNREAAEIQSKMLADDAFRLAADPTKTSGNPDALKPVPEFDFKPLEDAVARLKASAAAYDDAVAKNGASLSPEKRAQLWPLMQTIDQTLAPAGGLPGRPWYKNLIYAPGRYTGYGAKTLPAVREAVENQEWSDADKYIPITAAALNAYSDRLDQATKVMTMP